LRKLRVCSRFFGCVSGVAGCGGVVNTRELGRLGERIAESFLVLKGFGVFRKNVVYAGREIDLLVRKGTLLVAVEVKLRRGESFGRAVEAVDERKLARVRQALEGVLSGMTLPLVPRVDVVVIDVDADMSRMTVQHIEAVC
jgi:putative endonuclease